MSAQVDASTLKAWLAGGGEIALLDAREHGQFGEAHPFFAVPLPYSRFELGLPTLVPNPSVRLVLCDAGDGIAARAAARAETLGYTNVKVLDGGVQAWQQAGYTLYAGVNVPSKAFGELVEHERNTPRVTAQQLQAMREGKENIVIVDGRTPAEFRRMNIPDGAFCPNGELALRIGTIAPDPTTKIIVNCAGRTRSIIGAQTLIDFGVPNPIYALENGTQGWSLAGFQLEHGKEPRLPEAPRGKEVDARRAAARELATAHGVAFVAAADVQTWLTDTARTVYLFDVRTAQEVEAVHLPGFTHAPGGQLIQTTDQWVGVKGARLVLADFDGIRAPVVAAWLRQLGHEAGVLEASVDDAQKLAPLGQTKAQALPIPRPISAGELAVSMRDEAVTIIDLRPSVVYREAHIAGAVWSIRPLLASAGASSTKPVVLVADEPGVAALAALDLSQLGCSDLRLLEGGVQDWREAGLTIDATPDHPSDAKCIDFLFFTAKRHDGGEEGRKASRQYLEWEIGLVGQLDAQERDAFRIRPPR